MAASPFLDKIEISFKNRHLPIVEGKIEVDELLLLYKQAKENVDTKKFEILAV
ncbi:hypothetical protein COCSUDRAFT_33909 [Coccomyxa subellipsoidea C-169]|uniref:Uncharacterized protein n=1 Tax=Coccomyxa subellipsoidea (strain C-169) TaxID=574566 RepID=I0YR19_COCSC|nr:hypothetical protein COCSUDRAFT_33909 [Coccomyxa subellipsoidea C-169]EIE20838.1 hypothetical protein COCSUDRAFT_33909 [Coccomyxa subellipsoidea C-169]|eukprot:XP_005645382.1 hypothetical protein COCSUDRAFT_33909 [Coccomyxa subellipsoidea C-169]